MFASALSYCLAVAIVYFRDTGQIVGIVMQLWFFLTPVMYPVDMIPEDWNGIPLRSLLALNPDGRLRRDRPGPALRAAASAAGAGAVLLGLDDRDGRVAAMVVYRRRGRDVSEAI